MSVEIISREAWGAQYRDGDITLTNKGIELFIHHTASVFVSLERVDEIAHMRMLERTGQQRFGQGISYNVVVFPSGRVYRGVSWNRRGTHTGGRNSTARSICFAGNFQSQEPTAAALRSAAGVIDAIRGNAMRPDFVLRLHRDVKATSCCGDNLVASARRLLTDFRSVPVGSVDQIVEKPVKDVIAVDGNRGPATITRWQWSLGTVQDGSISRPRSTVVEADQHFLNKNVPSAKIRELTGRSRLDEDGAEGSKTIRVRQWYLFSEYASDFKKIVGRDWKRSDIDGSAGPITTKVHQVALNGAKKGKGY